MGYSQVLLRNLVFKISNTSMHSEIYGKIKIMSQIPSTIKKVVELYSVIHRLLVVIDGLMAKYL